jgi:hypothetical protein
MIDRPLDKYLIRKAEDGEAGAKGDHDLGDDTADDLGCFGWLRGVRDRAIMLELRKHDGSITAIGYAWLERVQFDPSEGITLHLLGRTIRIKGRNLNNEVRPQVRLFHGIARHRVPWIQEVGGRGAETGDGASVESIDW